MTRGQKARRLLAIVAVAALIAGSITGTMMVTDDPAWPGRGGTAAVFQISALFTAYCFVVALPVGVFLSIVLSPLMRRGALANAASHVAIGLLTGLAVSLVVDLAIRERIDEMRDFIGGALAGGAAGLMWWLGVQRHELRAVEHG